MDHLNFLCEWKYEEHLDRNKKYFESQKLEIPISKGSKLLFLDAYLFNLVALYRHQPGYSPGGTGTYNEAPPGGGAWE